MDIPSTVRSSIQESLACQIIGFTLSTTLYGITILQTYFYYRQYGTRDGWPTKLLIAVLLVIDTLTTIFLAHAMYTYVVLDFGAPSKTDLITWSFASENFLGIVSAVLYQCYFARRLWIFSHHNKTLVALILFFAIVNAGSGMALTVRAYTLDTWASLATVPSRAILGLFSGSCSVCDALITAGLCYFLQAGRTGIKGTDTLIDRLIIYAIERGLLTTICQIMHMILTVALPGHAYFLPFAMMESKLYANALLATLNVRNALSESEISTVELTIPDFRATTGSDTATQGRLDFAHFSSASHGSFGRDGLGAKTSTAVSTASEPSPVTTVQFASPRTLQLLRHNSSSSIAPEKADRSGTDGARC
ncbi:hypothetical protein GY45DRAFT_1323825 [Cubamyces sp. BRFM 1775]|nr:hypothetical protein GY45DRAFT_1323825 [Cubamyces sp. BRFM 1775]